ncbi:MAG: hypothetical protein AB7V45_12125 [Candidatus Krumholzibacteriia bacterium]
MRNLVGHLPAGIPAAIGLVALIVAASAISGRPAPAGTELGRSGFLIIMGARDSSASFQWRDGPAAGQRSLVWPDGQLVLPDTLVPEPYGAFDLGVIVTGGLAGSGAGGRLDFRDGSFAIDEPLVMTDGTVSLLASAGTLEIRGPQLRYRAPPEMASSPGDPRAGFLLLAGIILLVVVLMRRVNLHRRRMRDG